MKSELEIKEKGMNALKEKLNPVELEKFLTIVKRENFDYTKWQQGLWPNLSVKDIMNMAKQ